MKKLINNIPNLVTVSRIVSCILGATFFVSGNVPTAVGCYVYGAVSDALDGFLARKLDAITNLGKKLDPVSDKLFALSLMMPSIILGNYIMIIPMILEGIISGINAYSELKYKQTYTELVGKIKTILLFPTMILGLLCTKNPYFYVAFLPSLVISSDLQGKSMLAYMKQLERNKRQVELCNNEYSNDIKTKKKVDSINNNINLNNSNVRTKKRNKMLVRKKDYNDRY